MTYCTRCLYPDTKPDLSFDEQGVCSACQAFDRRETIDWRLREEEFRYLAVELLKQNNQYDCIIPVSGGKDSTYQVIKALEYGLRPLAVTATTDHLSSLGRANLSNISRLGVDHIEVTTDQKLRRRINAYTLREVGDISWAEHVTIFTVPLRIAVMFKVPLIIWGENPQHEYGGPDLKSQEARELNQRWLEEFGGLNGLRVTDIMGAIGAQPQDLSLYVYPKQGIENIKGIFLGQFFSWDGAENALISCRHGFKTYYGPVEGVGYDYENLDNCQTGIHDYFKWLKFGFGRSTDLVCNHIRRQRITRTEARQIIGLYDGQFPRTYLGVPLETVLEPLEMSVDEFLEICNQFANKKLFECRKGKIPKPTFKVC